MIPKNFFDPATRKTLILLLEVRRSNPHGNPDEGNYPTVWETPDGRKIGIIRGVSIHRRTRDNANLINGTPLHIARGANLHKIEEGCGNDLHKICERYWDARVFGGANPKGQQMLSGPVTVTDLQSISPIEVIEGTGSRVAGYPKKGKDDEPAIIGEGGVVLTGVQHPTAVVNYGIYRGLVHVDPCSAEKTGMTAADFEQFVTSLIGSIETSVSSARRDLRWKGLWIFEHGSKNGTLTPDQVERLVTIRRADGKALIEEAAWRWEDYEVDVKAPKRGQLFDLLEEVEITA